MTALQVRVKRSSLSVLGTALAFVGLIAPTPAAEDLAPGTTWKVRLVMASAWRSGTREIVVDSSGHAARWGWESSTSVVTGPPCKLDKPTLARVAEHVAWISTNVKTGRSEWRGKCADNPETNLSLQSGERSFLFQYQPEEVCWRDPHNQPPLAVMQLADELLHFHAKAAGCKWLSR
jgi:hypothetical protein